MNRLRLTLALLCLAFFAFAQTPQLIKDINPGAASSEIDGLTQVGNSIFFFANDGTSNGYELWRTDGTDAGTQMIQDVNNSTTGGAPVFSNPFSNLIVKGGEAFWLSLETTSVASEYKLSLWKAGPSSNATLVKQILVNNFRPYELVLDINEFYWIQGTEAIWRSDGTEAGTIPIVESANELLDKFLDLELIGANIYFTRQTVDPNNAFNNRIDTYKIYRSGDFAFSRNAVGDAPITCGRYEVELERFGIREGYVIPGSAACNYTSFLYSEELGTFSETSTPISGSGIISPYRYGNDIYYFAYANQLGSEYELKKFSNGQTTTLKNVGSHVGGFVEIPGLNQGLLFLAGDALWKTNGTAAETQILKSFDQIVFPTEFQRGNYFNRFFYFFVAIENGVTGFWVTDGTTARTTKVVDFPSTSPNAFDSYHVSDLIVINDLIVFSGDDGQRGTELWKIDFEPAPPTFPCNNNMLVNSGFENGLNGWTIVDGATLSSDAFSGSNAAAINKTGDRILQIFPAQEGEEFTASGLAKSSGLTSSGQCQISFLSSTWQPILKRASGFWVSGEYEPFSHSFTAPANTAWVEVSYFMYFDQNSFLLDDVCFSKVGVTPTCSIMTTVSNIQCNDASTPNDPTDDTFGFSLSVDGTNASNIFRITDYVPNPTLQRDYGTTLLFDDLPIGGGDFTLSIEDGFISNCSASVTVTPPTTCSNGTGSGDLVLIATGDPTIPAWSDGIAYFEMTNQSGITFEDVQVTFDFDANIRLVGGNEYTSTAGTTLSQSWSRNPVWNVGTMSAGEVKHIALNVYSITNSPMEIYAQISQATGQDVTSTPGNGTPPTVNEDDEVLWKINDSQTGNLPDLRINSVSSMGGQSLEPGTVWNYILDVSNQGNASVSGDFTIKTYFSTDNILSPDDIQDGTIVTGNFGANTMINDIPGASIIPASLQPGDYYMIVKIDADEAVVESDESNNIAYVPFQINNNNSPCEEILFSTNSSINCIEKGRNNNSLKVIFDSPFFQFESEYDTDLNPIQTQTFSLDRFAKPIVEWSGSTLTKTNPDQTIAYQKTVPQAIQNQVALERDVIEFAGGYVFFGWEDSNQSNDISYGEEYIAIQTDNDFNILKKSAIEDFKTHYSSLNFSNIKAVSNSNVLMVARFLVNSNVTYRFLLLNENLEIAEYKVMTGGYNSSLSFSENACGNFTYSTFANPFCGTSLCTNDENGELRIEQDRIVFNRTYKRYLRQFQSNENTSTFILETQTEDGGRIFSNTEFEIGEHEDNYRTFSKYDSNDNLQWEKTYLIPEALLVRDIFELNGEYYILKQNSIAKLDCFDELAPPTSGVDLSLAFELMTNANPSQWSYFPISLKVTNRGTETANDVTVKFNRADEVVYHGGNEYTASQGTFQHWGDEIWRVGTLAPGESAIITINYYRISANGFTAFSEVESMSGTDINSTPGNGTCCTANEDDEAVLQIGNSAQGINNRSAIAENLGNEVFAIVGANPNPTTGRFNVEVYSNENQTSKMTIVDILGRPVFRKEVNLNEGHNTIPIELENGGVGMMAVKMTPFHPYLRQVRVMKVRD